ncbi:hypothetical protein LDC_1460, partial [sediment metagenome]
MLLADPITVAGPYWYRYRLWILPINQVQQYVSNPFQHTDFSTFFYVYDGRSSRN